MDRSEPSKARDGIRISKNATTMKRTSRSLIREWKNGRWYVMIQRPLGNKKDQDYDEDTFFEIGQLYSDGVLCLGWP